MCTKYLTGILISLFFVSFSLVSPGHAADKMMVYPAKNQSAEQQKKDENDCHQWAVKQSQYDPTQPQKTQPENTANKGRPVLGGAAAGAVVGGIVGSLDRQFRQRSRCRRRHRRSRRRPEARQTEASG